MYTPLKALLLRLLKAPTGPPEAPSGSHESVKIFRASPRFLTYRLLVVALGAFGVLIGFTIGLVATIVEGEMAALILLLLTGVPAVFGALLAFFTVRIDYDLRYYIVTDKSLRVREGAWVVKEKTITYANVQNLRVVQGPIQRLFGISDLKVDTAGGGGSEQKGGGSAHSVDVAGISNAREVRDQVLVYLRTSQRGAGLGDPDDEHGAHVAWSSARVVEALKGLRDSAAGLRLAARGTVGDGG